MAKHQNVRRFVTLLSAQRMLRDVRLEQQQLSLNQLLQKANRTWHGVELGQPDWSYSSHSLAFTAETLDGKLHFHVILNAYWGQLEFELPPTGEHSEDSWCRWIDTTLDSPHDIEEWQT